MVSISSPSLYADDGHLKRLEWKSVPALTSMQQVIVRTSNRILVGLPLCETSSSLLPSVFNKASLGRDPDWIDLNIRYTVDVATGGFTIRLFPKLLRQCVVHDHAVKV